jgi:acetyltransferase-like isoleucine patch superfamily enzyme
LIAFEEETGPELIATFAPADRRRILVGQIGKMLRALEDFGAGTAIMAGQISPRKLFKGLHPDLKAIRILATLKRRNAETIFGAIADEISGIGVTLLDARSFLDDQLATSGSMTGRGFPIEQDYVDHGIQIARECARLDIGRYCAFAHETTFIMTDANHATSGPSTYPFPVFGGAFAANLTLAEYPATNKGSIKVGNDVWCGYKSTILPGVTVGSGAIVAACAVVARDVPPYAIVAGNPGKVVKMRFDPPTVERLLALAWWDWPADKVAAAVPALVKGDVAALVAFAK